MVEIGRGGAYVESADLAQKFSQVPNRIPDARRHARDWGRVHLVDINSLVREGSPRSRGEDPSHIQRLVTAQWPMPPILVHRPTMRIIDGFHRVSAATLMGADRIEAHLIDGSLESTFVYAVEANLKHGLPLTISDRRSAAEKILQTHSEWSDRAVAAATGLSPKTIRAIRCANADNPLLHSRVGKDGRVRPLNAAVGRQLAADYLTSHPKASLREVANAVGISPNTVRDVRANLGRAHNAEAKSIVDECDPSGRDRANLAASSSGSATKSADIGPVLRVLSKDPALRMNGDGRELLHWLHLHAVNHDAFSRFIEHVPDHSLDHLVELATRCSTNWARIARDLAARSRRAQSAVLAGTAEGEVNEQCG